MKPVKEFKVGNKTLQLFNDESPSDPRGDDNLGKMICFHTRYSLGDNHDYKHGDYNGWDELKAAIIKKEKAAIILPLFLYDHSGITMKTTPFSCPWDSGKVGFIIISKEKIREEYSVKRINKALIEKVTRYLIGEVEAYDQFLTGDIYGFKLIEDGEETDSCWGFYGSDIKTNGVLDNIDKELADQFREVA